MKILFLNPPFKGKFSREQRSPAITKSGTLYYPMWLAYCAGYVEAAGFTIDLVDAPAAGLSPEQTIQRFLDFNPTIAVVSTSTPSVKSDLALTCKLLDLKPDLMTVLVGPHVSVLDRETLDYDQRLFAVARREYEQTVLELCQSVSRDQSAESIPGLTYRHEGTIVRNPDRPFLDDLDVLPFVSKTYHNFLNFKDYFSSIARYPQVTIVTGRGCPFGCHFCVYPQTQMGKKYRFRSIPVVLDEIEFILTSFPGLREIFFEDDTLTANKKRCLDFCQQIKERNLVFSWTANSRADIDYETLAAMKKAGCRLLCVGIESGVQRLLEAMGKNLKLDQVREFFNHCKRVGILVHGCFMVGNPGETRETMKETLRFALSLKPDTAQFFPIMVYPGTKTYDWAFQNNYLQTDDFSQWLTSEGLHNCVVSTPDVTSEELVAFCNDARRTFYLRPRYFLAKLWQMLISAEERRRTIKSAMTFRHYIMKK